MRSFNAVPAARFEGPTSYTFEIGWEHDVVDGELVLARDDAGEPIARTYTVPSRITTTAMLQALREVGVDRLETLAADGGLDAVVELVGAVVGRDVVLSIAGDPTVPTDAFVDLVMALATELGLDEVAPPGPTNAPASGASSDS